MILNIGSVPQKECVYKRKMEEPVFKLLMRLEPKNTAWIEEIIKKFNKPRIWSRKLQLGHSLSHHKHFLPNSKRFKHCAVDRNCVTETMPKLMLLFARQMLSREPDIDAKGKVCRSGKIYLKVGRAINAQKRLAVKKVPEGPPFM